MVGMSCNETTVRFLQPYIKRDFIHYGRMHHLDEQAIRNVALQEILSPTFELTKQFLAVNNIVFRENMPYIEDVILDTQENLARVYFPIEGEQYYLVISITPGPQAIVSMIAMSPGNRVYFAAKSEVHSLEELLALTSVKPTKTWRKGEKRGKSPRHSGFEVRPFEKETGGVEDKLHVLLDILLPFKSALRSLSTLASIGIYVVYYGYQGQMWGIHLDEETIRKLAELNLSVDFDLYASGPELKSCE